MSASSEPANDGKLEVKQRGTPVVTSVAQQQQMPLPVAMMQPVAPALSIPQQPAVNNITVVVRNDNTNDNNGDGMKKVGRFDCCGHMSNACGECCKCCGACTGVCCLGCDATCDCCAASWKQCGICCDLSCDNFTACIKKLWIYWIICKIEEA